jgi:hypothetical protein
MQWRTGTWSKSTNFEWLFREASIHFEEIFIRQTLGETVKVMKQNATFLCGPFTKEALTSAEPLIQVKSITS